MIGLGPVDGVFGETNLPAEQKKTSEDAWVSPPDEDHRRAHDHKAPPGQGSQAPRRFRLGGEPGRRPRPGGRGHGRELPPGAPNPQGERVRRRSQKGTQAQVSVLHAAYLTQPFAGSRATRHHRVSPGGRRRSEEPSQAASPRGVSTSRFSPPRGSRPCGRGEKFDRQGEARGC